MAAENFPFMPAPLQRTDLRCRVNRVEHSASVGVCELDASVSCASTRSQQIALKRTPGQCFHCSLVRSDTVCWPLLISIPNVQQVIIAAACQLLSVW